jgi:hypothetical protein
MYKTDTENYTMRVSFKYDHNEDPDSIEVLKVFSYGVEMPNDMQKKFLEEFETEAIEDCWMDLVSKRAYAEELKAEAKHEDKMIRKGCYES